MTAPVVPGHAVPVTPPAGASDEAAPSWLAAPGTRLDADGPAGDSAAAGTGRPRTAAQPAQGPVRADADRVNHATGHGQPGGGARGRGHRVQPRVPAQPGPAAPPGRGPSLHPGPGLHSDGECPMPGGSQGARGTGQRGGREDRPEPAVDFGQLSSQGVTAGAVLEMLVDGAAAAPAEPAAGVGAKCLRVRAAGRRDVAADVLLQVGLPEPFAGPHGQGRDAVGGQPEHRRDGGGRLAFDLQLPEDGAPAGGQVREGPGDQAGLGPGFGLRFRAARQPGETHVLLGHAVLEVLAEIADNCGAAAGPQPVVGRVAHRRQQVRPEGQARPAAGPDCAEHAREGLRDDIVGDVTRHHRQGHPPGGRCVLDVQLLVGLPGDVTDRQDRQIVRPAVPRPVAGIGDLFACCPAEHNGLRAVSGAGPIMPIVGPQQQLIAGESPSI